jgi:multiple sugar transport system substrate-binding protein
MLRKNLFISISLVVTLLFLLTACAPKEVVKTVVVTEVVAGEVVEKVVTTTPEPALDIWEEPVTLHFPTWTGSEAHLSMLRGFAEDYKKLHPNVSVEFLTIPYADYVSKLSIQLAGGDPPDCGWVFEQAYSPFIEAGAVADLSEVVRDFPDYDFDDFSQPALAMLYKGDALYGIAFSTSPFFMTYNVDIFKAAGVDTPDDLIAKGEWTWEGFKRIAKEVVDNSPEGIYGFVGTGGKLYTDSFWNDVIPIIWSYGGNSWSRDGKTCMMADPPAVEAMQLLHDMIFVDKSVVPPGEAIDFVSGTTAMTIHQLSRLAPLNEAGINYEIVPLPSGPAGYRPAIGQAAIMAFTNSPHLEIAKDFVAFMTTKENVATMAQFFPPARISVLESDVMAQNITYLDPERIDAAIAQSIIHGQVIPTHPEWAKIDLAMMAVFDKLWVPDADVQAILTEACEAAADYFK